MSENLANTVDNFSIFPSKKPKHGYKRINYFQINNTKMKKKKIELEFNSLGKKLN